MVINSNCTGNYNGNGNGHGHGHSNSNSERDSCNNGDDAGNKWLATVGKGCSGGLNSRGRQKRLTEASTVHPFESSYPVKKIIIEDSGTGHFIRRGHVDGLD